MMLLSPAYIPWALKFFTLLLICGCIGWLFRPDQLRRFLRRCMLSDLIALWLGYVAGFHLLHLEFWLLPPGVPVALWGLLAMCGVYLVLRPVRGIPHRETVLVTLMALSWALVIIAGFRFADLAEAAAGEAAKPPAALNQKKAPLPAPGPELLRYGLLLGRMQGNLRLATRKALAMQNGTQPPNQAFLSSFRLQLAPRLQSHLARELERARVMLWVELGLLGFVLVLWGYGRPVSLGEGD